MMYRGTAVAAVRIGSWSAMTQKHNVIIIKR